MQYAAVENHLGENYVAEVNDDEDVELIEEACEICLEYNHVIGVFDTAEEAEQHLL
jgi:hypothetical protein